MPISETMERLAHEAGIKLEIVSGIPVWEASPVIRHQKAADRIRNSIRPDPGSPSDCGCIHYADLSIRFPDGSQKRPDIAIFCSEPHEIDDEVTQVPKAVIEILSKGYEAKDLKVGVPFYLDQGVADVIVFDPISLGVIHYRNGTKIETTSPVEIKLQCGCVCLV